MIEVPIPEHMFDWRYNRQEQEFDVIIKKPFRKQLDDTFGYVPRTTKMPGPSFMFFVESDAILFKLKF